MSKANILIIDDNESDALLMEEVIKDTTTGAQTHVVHEALGALDFLNNKPPHTKAPRPDMIFLDLKMPNMDGHEFLRVAKADPKFCQIPVIVLSASQDAKDIDESYKLHANCCIVKPVNFMKFKKVVNVINDYWLGIASLPTND